MIKNSRIGLLAVLKRIEAQYISSRYLELTLLMTGITIFIYLQHSYILKGTVILLVPIMLLFRQILTSKYMWSLLTMLLIVGLLPMYHYMDNHTYLTWYWVAAVTLCLWTSQEKKAINFNARVLIGLCFLFATIWKILSPEFINGTFFHFTFLTDSRFFEFTELTTGISGNIRAENLSELNKLTDSLNRDDVGMLNSSTLVQPIAVFMAYWTVFIEGWIAIAFLMPKKYLISRYRDIPLLVFMATTYPIATVTGFAALLAAMGFAQSLNSNNLTKLVYVVVFLSIPLFNLPFVDVLLQIQQILN